MRGAHRAFFLDDEEKTRRGYAFIYGNADDWDVIRDPSISLPKMVDCLLVRHKPPLPDLVEMLPS